MKRKYILFILLAFSIISCKKFIQEACEALAGPAEAQKRSDHTA